MSHKRAISPFSLLLPFVVPAGVGIIFGLYPAVRAARLDPIEALRSLVRSIAPASRIAFTKRALSITKCSQLLRSAVAHRSAGDLTLVTLVAHFPLLVAASLRSMRSWLRLCCEAFVSSS